MTKITFLFSMMIAVAIFASSCQSGGETNVTDIKTMYETKMDSLKITMQRSFDAKMDSVTSAYNSKIQELKVQMAGSKGKSSGVTSKPKGTTTKPATNTPPKGKVDVNNRGGNTNAPTRKVDVNKRGG